MHSHEVFLILQLFPIPRNEEPVTRTETNMWHMFHLIRRDATARRVLEHFRTLSSERKIKVLELARRWLNAGEWKTFCIKSRPIFEPEVTLTHITFEIPNSGAKIVKLRAKQLLVREL